MCGFDARARVCKCTNFLYRKLINSILRSHHWTVRKKNNPTFSLHVCSRSTVVVVLSVVSLCAFKIRKKSSPIITSSLLDLWYSVCSKCKRVTFKKSLFSSNVYAELSDSVLQKVDPSGFTQDGGGGGGLRCGGAADGQVHLDLLLQVLDITDLLLFLLFILACFPGLLPRPGEGGGVEGDHRRLAGVALLLLGGGSGRLEKWRYNLLLFR